MKIKPYALEIIPGVEDADGYVRLQHGQQYIVRLTSDYQFRSDVHLFVDGKSVRIFRVPPNASGPAGECTVGC